MMQRELTLENGILRTRWIRYRSMDRGLPRHSASIHVCVSFYEPRDNFYFLAFWACPHGQVKVFTSLFHGGYSD
ncbi:uncharacterized protein H6S33_013139 [Morchella sextelata]|uniref:uncharacterized protein n=1 Tax=Morchella sextelata TaxID=1174677 RepID=UPI001D04A4FB|nr:uncharacterized protein H6S33_013139 [Morchella sextelata]KAH0609653.1 hypothetical protein H6S33_013139 [Morchella sextelata]